MNNSILKFQHTPIDRLVPYARNSRVHTDAHIAELAGSIREFGFNVPVLIDEEFNIIAGHGRVLAARVIGLEDVPTVVAGHLTDTQRRAFVLADNKIHDNSSFDFDMLNVELDELRGLGFDLALSGFGEDEFFGDLMGGEHGGLNDLDGSGAPDKDPDKEQDAEEIVDPVTRLGDVWLLGDHRIVCGDSTEAHVVDKALNGAAVNLMVTDPPYGVEYDPGWRSKRMDKCDGRSTGLVENDDKADWSQAFALFPGNVAYIWHAYATCMAVMQSALDCGFVIRSQIIWVKNQFVISRCDYHPQHELCLYAVKKGKTGSYNGDRTQSTVWNIQKQQKKETGHSTQKPVECMLRPIENNSKPGDYIYDPFVGSGTTIIACEQSGRKCCAIELSPKYVDVVVKRWEEFSGKKATLESTGEYFKKGEPGAI